MRCMAKKKKCHAFCALNISPLTVYYVLPSLDQSIAVASASNTLTIHNLTGKILEEIPPPSLDSAFAEHTTIQPGALQFASRSRYLLFGDADGIVHIWDRKDYC